MKAKTTDITFSPIIIFDDISFSTTKVEQKCPVCNDPNCTFDPNYKEDKPF